MSRENTSLQFITDLSLLHDAVRSIPHYVPRSPYRHNRVKPMDITASSLIDKELVEEALSIKYGHSITLSPKQFSKRKAKYATNRRFIASHFNEMHDRHSTHFIQRNKMLVLKMVIASCSDTALIKAHQYPHTRTETPALRAVSHANCANHHACDYKEGDAKQCDDINRTLDPLPYFLPVCQDRIQRRIRKEEKNNDQGGNEVTLEVGGYEVTADEFIITWIGPTPYELFCGNRLIPIFTFLSEQYFDSCLRKVSNEMIEWAFYNGGDLHRYQMDTLIVHGCLNVLTIKLRECLKDFVGVYCDHPSDRNYVRIPNNMRIPIDWRVRIPEWIKNAFRDRDYFGSSKTWNLLWFFRNFQMYTPSKFGIKANIFEILDFWYNEPKHNKNRLWIRFYPRLLVNLYYDLKCYTDWFVQQPKWKKSDRDMQKADRIQKKLEAAVDEIGPIVDVTEKAFSNEINCAYSYRMLGELKDITPNY